MTDESDIQKPENLTGQILPEEGALLRSLARNVRPPSVIVELGSYTGKSTCCLAVGSAEGHVVSVFSVDLRTTGTYDTVGDESRFFQYNPEAGEPQRNSKFSRQPAYDTFKQRIARWDKAGVVEPITGMTTEVAKAFDEDVGLLFIDADHRYEAVKADFEAWAPQIVPGGYLAFHDYKDLPEGQEGVKKLVDEAVTRPNGWEFTNLLGSLYVARRR